MSIFTVISNISPPVRLVAVTKNRTPQEVLYVLESGAEIIAENRVREAQEKFDKLASNPLFKKAAKHLIGHLQTNKAKFAVKLFDMIQSVDSLKVAEAINREARKLSKVMPALIQINISGDEKKFGADPENLEEIYEDFTKFHYLEVKGLMTITKNYEDKNLTKNDFRKMKSLFDDFSSYAGIDSPILSMGMSDDYKQAIECGSNMVRVGRALFPG